MLSIYIKSVVIYWTILNAVVKLAKFNLENNNINLEDYIERKSNKNKLSVLLISAVPIFRFFVFLIALLLSVCTKEILDKIYKDKEED